MREETEGFGIVDIHDESFGLLEDLYCEFMKYCCESVVSHTAFYKNLEAVIRLACSNRSRLDIAYCKVENATGAIEMQDMALVRRVLVLSSGAVSVSVTTCRLARRGRQQRAGSQQD